MTTHRADRCPACGKTVALNNQGRIGWHRDTTQPKIGDAYHHHVCAGFRQLPGAGRTESSK